MNKKIILFSQDGKSKDLYLIHEKIKSFKPILILIHNEELFYKAYDHNVECIIYYNQDLPFLNKILKKYPKDTKFKLIEIENFLSINFTLDNCDKIILTNKILMSFFLETLNIYSSKLQALIIKKTLVNAVNLNLSKINSSLLYFTIKELNLTSKILIPDIREYLKKWINDNQNYISIKIPNFISKSFRINTILTQILKEYKNFASTFPDAKSTFSVFENAFYLEKYYKNNIELIKNIRTTISNHNKNL